MRAITDTENVLQYESRFSLTEEQILSFASITNLFREIKFQMSFIPDFNIIHNSHSHR